MIESPLFDDISSFSNPRLPTLPDQQAARMADLIRRETAAVMMPGFFVSEVEEEVIAPDRNEELNS